MVCWNYGSRRDRLKPRLISFLYITWSELHGKQSVISLFCGYSIYVPRLLKKYYLSLFIMETSADHLVNNYIKRITELRDKTDRIPTTEELKDIASELGVTTSEINIAQELSKKSFIKGKNYLKIKEWDDAIVELTDAIIFNPSDFEMLICLGQSYLGNFRLTKNNEYLQKGKAIAKQCLEIDPDHQPAYALLSEFNKVLPQKEESTQAGCTGCISMIIGLTVLGWLASFFN